MSLFLVKIESINKAYKIALKAKRKECGIVFRDLVKENMYKKRWFRKEKKIRTYYESAMYVKKSYNNNAWRYDALYSFENLSLVNKIQIGCNCTTSKKVLLDKEDCNIIYRIIKGNHGKTKRI